MPKNISNAGNLCRDLVIKRANVYFDGKGVIKIQAGYLEVLLPGSAGWKTVKKRFL
jgi:hypothetical protein